MNKEEGFTGLEAAIVLIAFVVVAAVFSYVVLGAGFFTTQKSQEVVYTSVDMASSSMEIIGDVYGLNDTAGTSLDTIRFTLGLAAGGSPVDFSTVQMVFATSEHVDILNKSPTLVSVSDPGAGNWSIFEGASDTDVLLEGNDMFTIVAMPANNLSANQLFNLEIRPSVGAAFGLKRTIPAKINKVNLLY
ncbi:archaellin/type IV pilin N-terminal domain-containing protein [Methanogenium sp. MK-MG]|uniref:archaellin/type IV pilin N-terminal domain-containing protein n=1 Tax=Methanogenium sp. MK-MG TaxID=2599926 RepID=UPI0020B1587F|nr:archaellin/type IV pilin N-terminal domain-containing protein [Methanogenium sp. MK-MG]